MLVHEREACFKLAPTKLSGRNTVVCAGGDGRSVCWQDSGSPLIDQETRQLIGVASFIIGGNSCSPDYPAVFTRVGSYISFIKEYLECL